MKEFLGCCLACLEALFIWGIFAVVFYLLFPLIFGIAIVAFAGLLISWICCTVNMLKENSTERIVDEK